MFDPILKRDEAILTPKCFQTGNQRDCAGESYCDGNDDLIEVCKYCWWYYKNDGDRAGIKAALAERMDEK